MSDTTLEDFTERQAVEYGTYRATEPIFYNGARAFNAGDAVPVSHVEQYGYDEQGLVEKVTDDKPKPEKPKTSAASDTEKKD